MNCQALGCNNQATEKRVETITRDERNDKYDPHILFTLESWLCPTHLELDKNLSQGSKIKYMETLTVS